MNTSSKIKAIIVMLVILVFIATILTIFILNRYPQPNFKDVQNGYELQRLNLIGNKVSFISAGNLTINNGELVGNLDDDALFPWEQTKKVTPQVWGNYKNVLTEIKMNNQTPQGIIEYFGSYYLVAKYKKDLTLYALAPISLYRTIEYEKFIKAIKKYNNNDFNDTVSGGYGLEF